MAAIYCHAVFYEQPVSPPSCVERLHSTIAISLCDSLRNFPDGEYVSPELAQQLIRTHYLAFSLSIGLSTLISEYSEIDLRNCIKFTFTCGLPDIKVRQSHLGESYL